MVSVAKVGPGRIRCLRRRDTWPRRRTASHSAVSEGRHLAGNVLKIICFITFWHF